MVSVSDLRNKIADIGCILQIHFMTIGTFDFPGQ